MMRPGKLLSIAALLAGCSGSIDGQNVRGLGEATAGVSGTGAPALGPGRGDPAAGPQEPGTAAGTGAPARPGEADPSTACTAPDVGAAPMRRLTRSQYANAVRDLLGVEPAIEELLPPDERLSTFRSNVIAPVSGLDVEQYAEVAELVAAEAVRDLDRLVACDRAALGDAACAARFIARVGRLAHHQPLAPGEQAGYEALFARYGASDFTAGISVVLEAMLQSPALLYLAELPAAAGGTAVPAMLSDYELAARLALFLWNGIPDGALLDAAERGELRDPVRLADQAQRMLRDPRARDAVASFHLQWMGVDALPERSKDAALFPAYGPELAAAMLDETAAFASHVVLDGDGRLQTLLTSTQSFASEPLRDVYGLAAGAQALDPAQRAGILTHASFLASHAHANQSAPVLRGKTIRSSLLCDAPPPPPPDVNTMPPEPAPGATTRERFAAHTQNARCAGCHAFLDPVGFGFEHYDAIGRYRARDQGQPVDASGELFGTRDSAGPFDGAIELASKLAQSEQVRECVSRHWLQFALGRGVADADECSRAQAHAAFAGAGYDLRVLLGAIVGTDAFRLRKVE
jgi:hypothetical protein